MSIASTPMLYLQRKKRVDDDSALRAKHQTYSISSHFRPHDSKQKLRVVETPASRLDSHSIETTPELQDIDV
jgi:hypothetical protein